MKKYFKITNWIIGGVITLFFLYGPMLSMQYDSIFLYKGSRMLAGLFITYCLLSAIYWIKNKDNTKAIHYCLIISVYIIISIAIFVIAVLNK